jgi:hypothetical protein
MTWKNDKPTPKKRFRWDWHEIWATIGVSGAVVIIAAAFFYGYSL